MAQISKEDLYTAIQNAPQGTDPQVVINSLISHGHDLEGYPVTNAPIPVQNAYHWNKISQTQQAPVEGIEREPIAGAIEDAGAKLGAIQGGLGLFNLIRGIPEMVNAVRGLQSVPQTAEDIANLSKQAGDVVANRSSKIEQMIGGFNSDMANGKIVQDSIRQSAALARNQAGQAFETLKTNIPNVQGIPTNLNKSLLSSGLDLSQLPKQFQNGKLASLTKDYFNNLSESSEPSTALSLRQMMDLRNELSQLTANQTGIQGLAGQVSNQGRIGYNLINSLDKDISSLASRVSPEFVQNLNNAREGWKTFKQTFSNPIIENIMSANPSDVAQMAFRSPESLNAVESAGGDVAMTAVKNSTVQQMMTRLGNVNKPQSILEKILAAKPDETERLFTPSEISVLRDFTGARQFALNLPQSAIETGSNPVGAAFDFAYNRIPTPYKAALSGAAAAAGYDITKKLSK